MTQVALTNGIDFNSLSAADLAKLLAKAREAEKARKAEIQSLPMFAFFVVMADGTVTPWAGKAANRESAEVAALEHAKGKGEVFYDSDNGLPAMMPRPIPAPRGRKAKVKDSE